LPPYAVSTTKQKRDNLIQAKKRLQSKHNQVISKYQGYFTKPVYKFIRQLIFGIYKSRHAHLSKISRSLNESIALKKTWERFSRNLFRKGLSSELMRAHIRENAREFKSKKFWVLDETDISKAYAQAMEGLGSVWDGSNGEKGTGYWVVNVAGISTRDDSISLMYSELFSLDHEQEKGMSSNKKITLSISTLRNELKVNRPVVIDRGGDSRKIIEDFIENKQQFIIRQRGDRHIYDGRKRIELKSYAKEISCSHEIIVKKQRHGKYRHIKFYGGARRVWFPKEYSPKVFPTALWLIRLTRQQGKAESWYLCYIPVETEREAVEMVVEGYGCRWKVEEVHRQIKQDYNLESIQLQRYTALKNFNAIFWTAMNFIYQHLDGLCIPLIMNCKEKLSYRPTIRDFTGFVYYKLAIAVSLAFSNHKLYNLSQHSPPRHKYQLALAIE
jgi:hypothetical protein